jgi:hypothetical protein
VGEFEEKRRDSRRRTIICAAVYTLYPYRIKRATRRRVRDGTFAEILAPKRLEISSNGVRITGESVEGLTRWKAILDMPITKKALYMYLTSVQALVVPRHAFGNEESFTEFARAAERFWKASAAA